MQVSLKWAAATALLLLAGGVGWTLTRVFDPAGGGARVLVSRAAPSLLGAGPDEPAAPLPAAVDPLARTRARLFEHGSFAGTEPAGSWCVTTTQTTTHQLTPCIGLRDRFEYYLLGSGEVTADDLRALVQDEARRANGQQLADQIMALWDRYAQLRHYAWTNRIDPADRSTWLPVIEEQHRVRQQLLGADWAAAFFATEESAWRADDARLEAGLPPPPDPGAPVPQMGPGQDPAAVTAARLARYGAAATERLARVDAQWAAWQQRLDAARAEWTGLQQAANLSEPQRRAAMARYVQARFDAAESRRVAAILGL